MSSLRPALVAISHGTSSPDGQRVIEELVAAVAAALPDVEVRLGHVDVQDPDVATVLASLPAGQPAVVVPLLLSAGYHVHVDLTKATAADTVTLTAALGPHDSLVDLLVRRLEAAVSDLADPASRIVLVAAGSSDARAVADCRTTAEALSARLGREVSLAFLSAAEPRLDAHVAEIRRDDPEARIVAASYLLAPGYFQSLAEKGGADVITAPLLAVGDADPAELVGIVLDRYRTA
ncbi:MAG TPA: CbiX/SirB N-terminal domain-containing protein [Pseudolysinimonas sp.]|nr:CbiX/SirB N-terminal domain-containing protein [Pseudolysinimonas sp.]